MCLEICNYLPQVTPPPVVDIRERFARLRNRTADAVDIVESNANLDDTSSLVFAVIGLTHTSSTDDEKLGACSLYTPLL